MSAERPSFVLHDHRKPQPHVDLRLEQDGALRSWAVPKGLPTNARQDRLAIAVEDSDKSIADTGSEWLLHRTKDQPG